MAGRLTHPNVVGIYDIVEEDGRPWIIMELVPCRSLRDIVREDGPLTPAQAAEVGVGILAALLAAHAEGILHRDVKPANILVSLPDRVVLTDFGIARATDSPTLTNAGMLIGSPSYIAPERARGEMATAAGDLWALGASLYTAVEGRPPFDRKGALATLTAVVVDEPDPAYHAGALWPVISGLLRKDPAERLGAAEAEQMLLHVAANGDSALAVASAPVPVPMFVPQESGPEVVREPTADSPGIAEREQTADSPVAAERERTADSPVIAKGDTEASAAPAAATEPAVLAAPVVPVLPAETPAPPAETPVPPAESPVPPAETPAPAAPAAPAGEAKGRRFRRGRAGAAIAAVAVAVIAAAVTAIVLLPGGHKAAALPPAGPSPSARPSASAKPTASPSPSASPSVSPSKSPAQSAPASPSGSYGAMPVGFYRFTNSTGFSIGVPSGWQISHVGHYVYIRDPSNSGIFLLIDQSDHPQPNPLADWEQQQANRESSYPDYHLIRLESVSYPQAEKAADWEFTFDRDGIPVHILNRNILANAQHAYALYWSTPEADWTADYHYFQSFAATFIPAP